jgi:hypothetical protein
MSPASENLNDIEGAANAHTNVLEVFARSWARTISTRVSTGVSRRTAVRKTRVCPRASQFRLARIP